MVLSRATLFSSTSVRMSAAVNCFVTEPTWKRVSGLFGTSHSMLASPTAVSYTTESPCPTSTAPLKRRASW